MRQVASKPLTELTENVNNTCQSYAVLNKNFFNCFLKMAKQPADLIEVGRLFHKRGKDRSPAAVFDRGTDRRPELVERRCRLAVADDGGRM